MTIFNCLQYCIFLFLAVTTVVAKNFSGLVVDSETEAALANVSIILDKSDTVATTDHDGKFSFSAEVAVNAGSLSYGNGEKLKWWGKAHLFDFKSAPGLTSVAIYNLKGGRLFFREIKTGTTQLQLPSFAENMYLLRIGKTGGKFYTIKWADMSNNAVFTFGFSDYRISSSTKTPSLVFEKKDYQTEKLKVFTDSNYTSILVKMKPEIGLRVFDDTVRTYRLYFTEENLNRLLDFSTLVTNTYWVNAEFVQARLVMEGRTLDSIGVRFRGDQSIWDCVSNGKRKKGISYPQFGFGKGDICAKFSMKLDFNRYNTDFRLYGLKALNLRSMSADPTRMHEKLGFSLFEDMGIVSPRCAYARLFVNDSLWGLFGVTEEIDGRFTKSHFSVNGDGNLYKEIWPDENLYDGDIFEGLQTNNDPETTASTSDFQHFRDLVVSFEPDSGNFLDSISRIVDIPYFVRYIVVDRGIMNFDGIMSLYENVMRHNYFWYHDDQSGLFKLIPWDLDKVLIYPEPNFWTNNQSNGDNIVPNWNVVNSSYTNYKCKFDPGSHGGSYNVSPIDKDKFLRLVRDATWDDFRKQGQVFLDIVFTQEKVDARLGRWRKLIASAVGEDPTIDSTEWEVMVDSLSHTIPLMRTNLKMMIDTLIVR